MDTTSVTGRTRWRRFALVVVPAVAAAGTILLGMANGAIAASFSVSGSAFKVSGDELVGDGFVLYGGTAVEKGGNPANPNDPKVHRVGVSGIRTVTRLSNLCQSVVVPGTPITLVIRAGGNGTPVTATDLIIDTAQLQGNAAFNHISIGQDASSLSAGPAGATGAAGGFGLQANHIDIKNLRVVSWSTTAGTFNLNGLNLSINTTKSECFK
ncbi:MAG TPA: DUF6230 family protein [Rugosimonospora sp.]|nr:DUF6230 family protein [Rugosimonospora sp.]